MVKPQTSEETLVDELTDPPPPMLRPPTAGDRMAAWAVHALTASGILAAAMATFQLCQVDGGDPRIVFLWLTLAVIIDAIDGPFARRFHVKHVLPHISGRTIDDIVDFLTFTFIPLMMVWRQGWLPGGGESAWGLAVVGPAMMASLVGFANAQAKDEERGLFRGFPSYWNLAAFYAGFMPPWAAAGWLLVLAVLTVCPFWVVYPNLAPRPWRTPLLLGALAWTLLLLAMLPWYPHNPLWLVLVSLLYPLIYAWASWRIVYRTTPTPPAADETSVKNVDA